MTEPISISFCINDAYAQHLAVVIASMLIHNPEPEFVFHVLHRDIRTETEAKVKRLEKMYSNHRIVFHKVDESVLDGVSVPKTMAHLTLEAYFRYLLPDVLKDDRRTIYMDVDVLCVGDLRPLWEFDLAGMPLAAVPDGERGYASKRANLGLEDGTYFCSGLLVMDLDALRADGCVRRLLDTSKRLADKIVYADQDVINAAFNGRIVTLPAIWNCTDAYNPFRRDVRQWHFQCQTRKPWCNIWKNATWPVYLKYLLKTPYRKNALRFVWGHIKGFFYFRYTKNLVTRHLVCGIRVWRSDARSRRAA